MSMLKRLPLFPINTAVDGRGHLVIGGCDTATLAAEFGTPLYIYDELTLRAKCREFKEEFGKRYPNSLIIYAGKAYSNGTLLRLIDDEKFGIGRRLRGRTGNRQSSKFPDG